MKMNILRIKNLILASAALAALTLAGCAKSEKTEDNEAELRYLEAWVQVNHPDAQKNFKKQLSIIKRHENSENLVNEIIDVVEKYGVDAKKFKRTNEQMQK